MSLLYHVEDEEAYSRPKHTRMFNLFNDKTKTRNNTSHDKQRIEINIEIKLKRGASVNK